MIQYDADINPTNKHSLNTQQEIQRSFEVDVADQIRFTSDLSHNIRLLTHLLNYLYYYTKFASTFATTEHTKKISIIFISVFKSSYWYFIVIKIPFHSFFNQHLSLKLIKVYSNHLTGSSPFNYHYHSEHLKRLLVLTELIDNSEYLSQQVLGITN